MDYVYPGIVDFEFERLRIKTKSVHECYAFLKESGFFVVGYDAERLAVYVRLGAVDDIGNLKTSLREAKILCRHVHYAADLSASKYIVVEVGL